MIYILDAYNVLHKMRRFETALEKNLRTYKDDLGKLILEKKNIDTSSNFGIIKSVQRTIKNIEINGANNKIEAEESDARNKLMDVMLNYGLSGLDLIKQIQKEILSLELDNERKMQLIEKCGEIEFRMSEGSDEFIQLEALLSQFVLYGSKKSQ